MIETAQYDHVTGITIYTITYSEGILMLSSSGYLTWTAWNAWPTDWDEIGAKTSCARRKSDLRGVSENPERRPSEEG
jgi:hypothetical protein